MTAVLAACGRLAAATVVLLASEVVHLDAGGYGLLLAGAALASVLGGLVNARIVARAALLTALAANAGAFAGVGLSRDPVVLGGFLAVTGFVTTLLEHRHRRPSPAARPGRAAGPPHERVPPARLGPDPGGHPGRPSARAAGAFVAAAVRGIALPAVLPVPVRSLRSPKWTYAGQRRV